MGTDDRTDTAGDTDDERDPLTRAVEGLELRGIGPAFMGGRIADVAVHPGDRFTWYVAVGSGGVWKTTNAGTTWTPVFDRQPSFSIGCVEIDPTRPETVWVGTGEAVSGRHVAWGDGVYRSLDGGATWERMGLERSEHIGRILIDPRDGDVVYVAAEGPLWSAGGERGLFRTTDGGATWEAVLAVDPDPDRAVTGVTSAALAPDDPDTVYAATYQRRRSARSFVGGGPGSGIHVSADGGATWDRITEGLPEGDMGKIGLAVTPAAPHLVYATIEAAGEGEGGFYRSTTRGRTWERRCGYLSGGTGPHYYQEIFASPLDPERVFQVDVFLHRTTDGGATFHNLEAHGTGERCTDGHGGDKHSDNHVVWIDPDPALGGRHLLVGTDGGLYETFDEGGSWRHVPNLPVSQLYRVAVDDSVPFTTVLAGAQDLGTLCGPVRTGHTDGVRNTDWHVPLGADGYRAAFDPDDQAIAYVSWQQGNVLRLDRRTGELTDVKPVARPDDPPERWNWDTPIVIGPHRPGRIHLASQRVWRSDDRGDSWTPISPDLTLGRNRYELPTGGRVWSVDALHDNEAMSQYATVTDLSESPVAEGVLYAGTDDGLIQVSEDGGGAWRRAAELPGLPAEAFVNDVEAARDTADGVFVLADDHKSGDHTPYLYESTDRGRTWRSIRGDLPDGALPWSIEQDHVEGDLLFLACEAGLYASFDRGGRWHRLGGDSVPTISFRDLAIQRRDGDLVGASFGRGIFVLDDYAPLRSLTADALAAPAALLPVRDAWRYVPYRPGQSVGSPALGSTAFRAPNPPFGAVFTYHLADDVRSAREERREAEKPREAAVAAGDGGGQVGALDVPFPGWERLWEEHVEVDPAVLVIVRDAGGHPIRSIPCTRTAGLHRVSWDLRYPAPDPVRLTEPAFLAPWESPPRGPLAPAGRYTAELVAVRPGADPPVEALAGPEPFDVVDTPATAGAGVGPSAGDDGFGPATADLARRVAGAAAQVDAARERIRHLRAGLAATPAAGPGLVGRLDAANRRVEDVRRRLVGDPVRQRLSEPAEPSLQDLLGRVSGFHWETTGPPTATQRASVERAAAAFEPMASDLGDLVAELGRLAADLDEAGGPWTPR